ncbi:MAG: peptidoglycan-binding protein [Polyangiaceae bacterium]|nr:peptidoglycan-binding protein [Polyangiaceae bacterium]
MASPAAACLQAIRDANRRWPSRKKASDGIMGDARHQKTKSDHNMGNAFDLTHDPDSGCSGHVIAAAAIRDTRVKYVIWNRQIFNRQRGDSHFRPYRGKNPHTKHCHVSILAGSRTDTRPWAWSPEGGNLPSGVELPAGGNTPAPPPSPPRGGDSSPTPADRRAFPGVVLKRGMRGELVGIVQARLKALRWEISVDKVFGPDTERVVRAFQRRRHLDPDGEVGRRTWTALFG